MPSTTPAPARSNGQWAIDGRAPLNHHEALKAADVVSAPLVVALHPSRDPGWAAFAAALRDAVAAALPGVAVRVADLDGLAEALRAAGGGVVVPAFLTRGHHVAVDVPDAVARSGVAARVTDHVGPLLAAAVAGRIREAGGPGDGVLLAAAGSARASALREVEDAAAHLAGILGVRVSVGYLYDGPASVEDAAARWAEAGASDVTVAPYVLAPGRHAARLAALGLPRVAAPIGVHPVLVAAIARRYRAAAGESGQPAYLTGLHLAGRRVLVAGAGAVASRRVGGLLDAGAEVLVVAPEASPAIRELAASGRLEWAARQVRAEDADGAWFVLAATSSPPANALVAAAAEERHTFCVRADAAALGSARTPAAGRAGAWQLGVLSADPHARDPRGAAAARDAALRALGDAPA